MASPTQGLEFEQAPGDSEEQGRLACCSPWSCGVRDTTDQLNKTMAVRDTHISNVFLKLNEHEFEPAPGDGNR